MLKPAQEWSIFVSIYAFDNKRTRFAMFNIENV